MAFSNQSTKLRLLKLLQHSLSTQPNTPVSLSELAQTLNVSRERVRQLYRKLAVEYTLPPVRKRRPGISEINRHQANDAVTKLTRSGDVVHKLRTPSPQTLALEAEVRAYSEQGLTAPEIAKRTGRPGRTIYEVLSRLGIPRNYMGKAVYSATSPQVLALEAEVRAYSEQGLTTAEIARKTGRHLQTIYRVLHRLHIPFNSVLRRKSRETQALEAEVRKYSEQGLSAPEIAGKIGRPRTTIYSVLGRISIPFTRATDTGLRNPKTRP